jgi:hypothetical protein
MLRLGRKKSNPKKGAEPEKKRARTVRVRGSFRGFEFLEATRELS